MAFEIFPQSVTLYPQDVQTFTVRATPPPPLWGAITNMTLQSDGTLNLDTLSSSTALIAQSATEGVAGVEFTFDSRMLPTSTGNIFFTLTGAGSHAIRVTVEATSTIVKDENANTIATVTHTVASGDTYYVEVAGNVLRLFINEQLSAEYIATGATRYPLRFRADGNPPFANVSPHLTVPRLIGQWEIVVSSSADNTWTPDGGTLDDSTNVWETVFTASNDPGVYELGVQIGGSANQERTATIIIEPLTILSPDNITMQPGETAIFRTNYDRAQNSLVTWAVVSGSGTFTNGKFTAGTAPGDTVIKATYDEQEDRITITVPAVMTITVSGDDVTAATPSEVLTLTTNMTGTINWTASVGSLSASSGATVTWTAPGQDGLEALIVATNSTYTVTATIPVLKAFPYVPNRPLKWDRKKTVLVSQSENRAGRASRVKNAGNEPFEAFELVFLNRNLVELDAVIDFWDEHYPNKRFIFTDAHRGQRIVLWFDSDIAFNSDAACATTYTFRAIEG